MERDALKDIDDLKHAVLKSIAAHDGQWYWYQLDCALIAPNPHMSAFLITAIQELESKGLIRITQNPGRPDLPAYWMTDSGTQALATRTI